MYDIIIEVSQAIMRNGLSLSALGTALFVLLKQRKVKRAIRKRIPWLMRDDADVMNYESRQIRIETKIDALIVAGGVRWDVDYLNGKQEPNLTGGQQTRLSLQQTEYAVATIAGYSTQSPETFRFPQRRMKMKSKWLSRKFLMALVTGILIVLNDGLDLGIDYNTVLTFAGLVATWIVGEAAVDIKRANKSMEEPGDTGPAE